MWVPPQFAYFRKMSAQIFFFLLLHLCNAKFTGPTITWPTYATPHLCINPTSQTKKFYASYRTVAKQVVSLDRQLAKKKYLQINAFLASGGGVERNLEALKMKTTASLGSRAIWETLSAYNESLDKSHREEQWQEIGLPGRSRPDSRDVNINLCIYLLLLWRNPTLQLVHLPSIATAQSYTSGVIPVIEWIFLKWGNGRNAGRATLQHNTSK